MNILTQLLNWLTGRDRYQPHKYPGCTFWWCIRAKDEKGFYSSRNRTLADAQRDCDRLNKR